MEAFEKSGSWQGSEVEVPAQVLLYQDQSFHDMDSHYRIVSKTEPGLYAFLTDEEQKIQAVFTLEPEKRDNFMTDPDKNKTYRLHVRRERLSPEIPAGRFHHWELLLLEPESVTEAWKRTEKNHDLLSQRYASGSLGQRGSGFSRAAAD